MLFTKTPLLEIIVDRIENTPINWKAIKEELKKKIVSIPTNERGQFQGYALEFHIGTVLEDLAAEYEISLDPIKEKEKNRLEYKYESGKSVYIKKEGDTYCELDRVILAGSVSAAIECKSGTWKGKASRGKSKRKAIIGVREAISEEKARKIYESLENYYGTNDSKTDIGYIVICLADQVKQNSNKLANFLELGGLISQIPITRAKYRRHIENIRLQFTKP